VKGHLSSQKDFNFIEENIAALNVFNSVTYDTEIAPWPKCEFLSLQYDIANRLSAHGGKSVKQFIITPHDKLVSQIHDVAPGQSVILSFVRTGEPILHRWRNVQNESIVQIVADYLTELQNKNMLTGDGDNTAFMSVLVLDKNKDKAQDIQNQQAEFYLPRLFQIMQNYKNDLRDGFILTFKP
jgi:hypothetical protein